MLGKATNSMNESNRNVLPENFDGTFKFTNWTDEDFVGTWDKIAYSFPANKTSPMIMNFTPVEIQNIRKKFARELAVREFYKTPKFQTMNQHIPGGRPALYTDSDLTPFVQRCLEPLPIAFARATILPKGNLEQINRTDDEGNLVTTVLDKKKSLIQDGSTVITD